MHYALSKSLRKDREAIFGVAHLGSQRIYADSGFSEVVL